MKKLRLDDLAVDSFAAVSPTHAVRGTVAGREEEIDTTLHCPDSYGGSCIISGCIPCDSAPCV
jgi:hypothetical protein